VHIQADPVFTDLDIGPCVTQFSQYGIQGIRLCIAADNFAA